MTPVPPPVADPLDEPAAIDPRPRADLVVGLMEARELSKPDAEAWIDAHGRVAAAKYLRARWTFPDRDRWSGNDA